MSRLALCLIWTLVAFNFAFLVYNTVVGIQINHANLISVPILGVAILLLLLVIEDTT